MATPVNKKSPEQASADRTSPLMAGAANGAVERDEQREARRETRRKNRQARRRQRDEDIASVDTRRGPDAAARKTSKPKLSRKAQDAKDARLGCCHKFGTLLVKLVHVLDALIGVTFIVYGALIATQFETPAMEAVATTLTYGSIALFTSVMGVVGFYSPRCKRVGLLVSAYAALVIAFFYLFAIIVELDSSASIFDYLTDHMDVLYLNEAEVAALKQMLPFFFVILASLTAIEICRFILLKQLRESLVRLYSANRRSASSKKSEGVNSTFSGLTEPLLADEEAAGAANGGDY